MKVTDPEFLKYLISKKGWTQRRLAKKCRVSKSYFNDIIRGRSNFPSDVLENVANALGISPQLIIKVRR